MREHEARDAAARCSSSSRTGASARRVGAVRRAGAAEVDRAELLGDGRAVAEAARLAAFGEHPG